VAGQATRGTFVHATEEPDKVRRAVERALDEASTGR
jgi:RNA binding exosome subunit